MGNFDLIDKFSLSITGIQGSPQNAFMMDHLFQVG
jgi:hypothetical protein